MIVICFYLQWCVENLDLQKHNFQERVAKPFITKLKANISRRFDVQDIVSSFSIFDLQKVPAPDHSDLLHYGEDSMEILLGNYGVEMPADSTDGSEYTTKALISSDICTEWKTYWSYLSKQPTGSLHSQLTELSTNEMLISMFPNISTLAKICLAIPIGTP